MKKIKKFTLSFLLIIAILITISGVVLHQKTYQASSEAQTAAKTAESTKDYLFFKVLAPLKLVLFFTKVLSSRKQPTQVWQKT